MFQILKDTEQRLVMMLGDRAAHWTKYVLDKDAGYAWFERGRRFLPPQTLTVRLGDITAIASESVGRGRTAFDHVVVTTTGVRLRLTGETGETEKAVERLRKFVGLTETAPHTVRGIPPLSSIAMHAGRPVAVVAVGALTVWLLAQVGGVVGGAAAKASGFVGRIHTTLLLPACDAPQSRDAIQELVRDRIGSGAVLADVTERGHNSDERMCSAIARRGPQTASVSYRNYWDGWTAKVRLTGDVVTLKLDTTRTAAIAEAIDAFLASSRGSHRTGTVPRHTDQAVDKALATIFGASDLAAEPLAPAEIDKALAWLKAADRVGAVYLLAGTGYDDFMSVPQSEVTQRRMRANVVAFADEFGRYADFQMVLLAAVANAQMRATRGVPAAAVKAGTIQADADDIRTQLAQAMKSALIALVYHGHNDAWRMARLTALGRTAPVAAKFLSRDDAMAVRELALQTLAYFKDANVRAKVQDVAALLPAP